jgi:hypothetical protein
MNTGQYKTYVCMYVLTQLQNAGEEKRVLIQNQNGDPNLS